MFIIHFSWTEDRISVVCVEDWDFLQYICWDSGNHLWLCDLMGAENAVSISKSSVESWVGCYMFAETMGACTHAFTSQDGINAFGVKQLGVEVCGISTFNSTQCLYSWMILAIHPYMDEIYGMITHLLISYPLEKYILMIWCHVKYYMRSMLKYLHSWYISTSFQFSWIEMWNLYTYWKAVPVTLLVKKSCPSGGSSS